MLDARDNNMLGTFSAPAVASLLPVSIRVGGTRLRGPGHEQHDEGEGRH